MALLNKLLTLYLLFNPLRALGLMADKPKVEPAGGMMCAPLSEIQEAVEHKNFSIPKWVTAEEVCEERKGKTLLFKEQNLYSKTQVRYQLLMSNGTALLPLTATAQRIPNWVQSHQKNNPNCSLENQCFLIVKTLVNIEDGLGPIGDRFCTYLEFENGVNNMGREQGDVEAPWNLDVTPVLRRLRPNCRDACPPRPVGCP